MLEIKVNKELGGNLTSIRYKGQEMLHQPDEKSWLGQDIAIFPFIARLKDGTYTAEGQEYSLKNHGLLRYMKPEVISDQACYKHLRFFSDEKTLTQYPYKFSYDLFYLVENNKLTVKAEVANTDGKDIFFELGFHPAIRIPFTDKGGVYDITGSYLDFGKRFQFRRYVTDEKGNFIFNIKPYKKMRFFPLTKSSFKNDNSYILNKEGLDKITLVRKDGIRVIYDLNKAPVLTIWTKEKAGDYICIEPWYGLPDYDKPDKELKDKPLMIRLEPHKKKDVYYSMKFEG